MNTDLIPQLSKYLHKLIVQPDEDAITKYLGKHSVTDIYTKPDTRDFTSYHRADKEHGPPSLGESDNHIHSLAEGLQNADHDDEPLRTIIFAPPGYGKSLFLKMKARKLAMSALDSLQKQSHVSTVLSIPICISVSSFVGEVPCSGESPESVLRRAIRERLLSEYPYDIDYNLAAYLAEHAHEQQIWLLLDDFHDWFINHQGIDWVLAGMRQWKSHVVITSRQQGVTDKPFPFPIRMNVLNGFLPSHVRTFLQRWWSTNSIMYKKVLNYSLNTQAGRQLSRNPLLLTLVCGYFQQNPRPEDITSKLLYNNLLMHLLGRATNDTGIVDVQRAEEWLEVLPALVYRFMKDNIAQWVIPVKYLLSALSDLNIEPIVATSKYSNKGSELLKELCSKGVLFPLGANRDSYIFQHQSIMEYLVARGITEIIHNNDGDDHTNANKWMDLSRAAWRSDWHQVFVFLAGMLSDPLPMIKMLIRREDDDIYRSRLILAAQCLGEVSPSSEIMNSIDVKNIGDELISTLCEYIPMNSYHFFFFYASRWHEIINDNIVNVIKPKLPQLLTHECYEARLRAAIVLISIFTEELLNDSVWKPLLNIIREDVADYSGVGFNMLAASTIGINRYIADKCAITKKLISLINIHDFMDNIPVIMLFRSMCEPTELLDAIISLLSYTREYTKCQNMDYQNRPHTSLQDVPSRSPLLWNSTSETIMYMANLQYLRIMESMISICTSDKYHLHLKTIAAGSNLKLREVAEKIIDNMTSPEITNQVTPRKSMCDRYIEYSNKDTFNGGIMYDDYVYSDIIIDVLYPNELEASNCIIPEFLNVLMTKPLSPLDDLRQIVNMSHDSNPYIRKFITLQMGPLQLLRYFLLDNYITSVLQKNINSQQILSRLSELLDDKCTEVRIAAAASYRNRTKRSCNVENLQDVSYLLKKCDKICGESVEWLLDQLHTGSPFDKLCAIVIIGETNEAVMKNHEIVTSLICMSSKRFVKEEENRYLAQLASQVLGRYGRMGLRIFPVGGSPSADKWYVRNISELTSKDVERDNNRNQQKVSHKYVKPSSMKAYLSFMYVCWKEGEDPKELEDKQAYQYLEQNGINFAEDEYERFEEYIRGAKYKKMWEHIKDILPKIDKYSVKKTEKSGISLDSWLRYLGNIRNILKMPKNTSRTGRTGRSIVNQKDI